MPIRPTTTNAVTAPGRATWKRWWQCGHVAGPPRWGVRYTVGRPQRGQRP
jgi:hypothetical protein